ncbi:hypothetical protein ACX0G9_15500 [Flavitalea flava]
MDIEQLQQIWNAQNSRPLYTINEKALHDHILQKKNQAFHITDTSELLLIAVYFGAGAFILGLNLFDQRQNFWMYILAAWILGTGIYILMSRIRRIKGNNRFDRSMRGELDHALSMATYQVWLSQFMRWNILPVALLILAGAWHGGKSIWIIGGMSVFFVVTYFASAFEHRIYQNRKKDLQSFQKSLEKEG